MTSKNIVLIGMPGAGKSTVGPILAKRLGLSFCDTDEIVKKYDGRALRDIVIEDGPDAFLEIQDKAIKSAEFDSCVIATGGGVVKSDCLMAYLSGIGIIIYLKQDFATLERRLAPGRRLAGADGQTFRQLYEERHPIYMKYADYIIECTNKTPEEIVREIIGRCLS